VLHARSAALAAGLAVALTAGLTACSGDEQERDDVVLGFLTMEGSPTASFPETTAGAQAAVAHVNDALGGVGGRRLRLETCATTGAPESSSACARQLLEAGPVAVVGGVDLGADASLPLLEEAGVPYVTGSPTLAAELTSPGSFAFTAGIAGDLLALAQHLVEDRGVTRLAVLHADLPGLLNTAVGAAEAIFSARQVDARLVAEDVDAPDFAAALTSATAGEPEALLLVFPPQSCARVVQAAASLGVETELFLPGACASPAVASAAAPLRDQVVFASAFEPLPADGGSEEQIAYRAGVPEEQRSPLSQASFGAVLNVSRVVAGGATDASAVRAALSQAGGEPSTFAHPYTCDGQQVPLLPSVCNANARLLRFDDGDLVDVDGEWIDGVDLVRSLGGG
jgi:branched-chain amino acid transport system substrate-binding protein